MIVFYAVLVVLWGAATLWLAWRSRDVRKFLAGAFFVSGGIQLYLAMAGVSVPLVGTGLVQTPAVGFVRGTIHLVLFLVCLYSGFLRAPRRSA